MPGGSPCGRCCRCFSSRRYSRRRLDWSRAHHAARVREMRQRAACSAAVVGPGCGLARPGAGVGWGGVGVGPPGVGSRPRPARVPVCGVGARTDGPICPKEAHTVARGVRRLAGGSGCRRGPARAGPARAWAGAGVGPARVGRVWVGARAARMCLFLASEPERTCPDAPKRHTRWVDGSGGERAGRRRRAYSASGPVGADAPIRPAKCADGPAQPAEVCALASSSMMITALISAR